MVLQTILWLLISPLQFLPGPPDYVVPATAPSISAGHSQPGLCTDGLIAVAVVDEHSIRPIATSDIQDQVPHAETLAQEHTANLADQWDYG